MELIKVVLRYADGGVIKGHTRDFFPNKSEFHLEVISGHKEGETIEVQLKDLKAVFFVRDFVGNPAYDERKQFLENQQISGRKVRISFKDGEVLVGATIGCDPKRQGFFIFPPDEETNNLKVYVVMSAVNEVEFFR
jgi:transcriptional antiterminator Rof (Rho-off)